MTTVLFVNHEKSEIDALREWFAERHKQWQMLFVTDDQQALEMTESQTIDCLVCDMNLPAQAGQDLLVQIAGEASSIVRIAHSPDPVEELRLESVHAIHRFVDKSDGSVALDDAITASLALHTELASAELEELIAGITTLPVLPEIYDTLMQTLVSDDFSMQAVCEIVELDMSLAATVLRIVNSPYVGMVQHVESAAHATQLLGVETIKNVLLTDDIISQVRRLGSDTEKINELNVQANARGVLAGRFARLAQMDKRRIDHSQIAEMLGGLGELIVESGLVDASGLSAQHRRHDDLIGSRLLKLWGLPDAIVDATLQQRTEQPPKGAASPTVILHCIRNLQRLTSEQDADLGHTDDLTDALSEYSIDASLARKWVSCFEDYTSDLASCRAS